MAWISKQSSGSWRARYRGPDGRQQQRTFPRRVDAEAWLLEQRGAASRGEWIDPAKGRILFRDYVRGSWQPALGNLRESTRALNVGVAEKYLLPRFGAFPLEAITASQIRAMVEEEQRAGTLSNSAIRRHVIVLSTILGAAVDDECIARNPCRRVRLPAETARPMRFLEAKEVAQLAGAFPEQYRPLILTAAYVGLRWGELAGLRADRVDLLRRRIRVDQQLLDVAGKLSIGPPKTRAGVRLVSVPASLVEVLAEHLGSAPVQDSGLAFPTPSGSPMRRSNFGTVWRRTVDGTARRPGIFAGTPLEGLVFHELRHTAAALAIAQGAHPLAIKERLGHSSITVTMDTYGGLFPRLDEAIAEGLDDVLRGSLAARDDIVVTSGVGEEPNTVVDLHGR